MDDQISPVRVLMAVPFTGSAESIRRTLCGETAITIVAEADTVAAAVAMAQEHLPHVALLHADLEGGGGMRACADIKSGDGPTRVLVICEANDRDALVGALEAGADGFVTGESGLEAIAESVRQVHDGHACVPAEMLGALLRDLISRRRRHSEAAELFSVLSRREREIAVLLARGFDHRGMAASLYVSPHTARTHIQNVLTKLGVHSRAEAAAFVIDNGLIPDSESPIREETE